MDSFSVVLRDLIAQCVGTVAILMVVGMAFGIVPITWLTISGVVVMGLVSAIAEFQAIRRQSH